MTFLGLPTFRIVRTDRVPRPQEPDDSLDSPQHNPLVVKIIRFDIKKSLDEKVFERNGRTSLWPHIKKWLSSHAASQAEDKPHPLPILMYVAHHDVIILESVLSELLNIFSINSIIQGWSEDIQGALDSLRIFSHKSLNSLEFTSHESQNTLPTVDKWSSMSPAHVSERVARG